MINKFRSLPIQGKLATIVMLICSLLVVMMGCLYTVDKIISFRKSMVETHVMLAKTIASNSSAALVFKDKEAAAQNLFALNEIEDIIQAAIITTQGDLFATYTRGPRKIFIDKIFFLELIPRINMDPEISWVHKFSKNHLHVVASITLDNSELGYITLCANLKSLYNRLFVSILVVTSLIILTGLVVQLVSLRLHKLIAYPLFDLLDTMDAVKDKGNYSYRCKKYYEDEFGSLSESFNNMLAEIQKRDLELEKHRNELEVLVGKRTKELLLANERLQKEMVGRREIQDQLTRAQRMEAVGTLASGVAHDLNNILSGIVSYPELMKMRLSPDHELQQPLETIRQSGEKAAAIVQDLLTLARRGATNMEVLDLKQVIEDYLSSPEYQRLLVQNPDIKVMQQLAKNNRLIKGSSVHLGKAIMNLVMNAFEAIEGRGVVTVTLSSCYLDRPVHGYNEIIEGFYILITVQDTGHGISSNDLKFIFEPFYTQKKMGISGTGLGMTVVWGTVEDHKGYIDVESVPNKGTTFYLYFPTTDTLQTEIKKSSESILLGSGEKILVVDDVREQRVIASDILKELGYSVKTVSSGEEAINYLKKHSADLVMLDMIMEPGINGIETYRQILENNPNQKGIIASGFSEAKRIEEAYDLGLSLYIKKPYTIESIARAVHAELHRS